MVNAYVQNWQLPRLEVTLRLRKILDVEAKKLFIDKKELK